MRRRAEFKHIDAGESSSARLLHPQALGARDVEVSELAVFANECVDTVDDDFGQLAIDASRSVEGRRMHDPTRRADDDKRSRGHFPSSSRGRGIERRTRLEAGRLPCDFHSMSML